MLDVSWVDEQLERVRTATATMQTARDYALLCICRDHLAGQEPKRRDPSMMDTAPTLDQVEAALSAITVTTASERDRMEDAMTWGKILSGKE